MRPPVSCFGTLNLDAKAETMIEAGEQAPEFTLPDQDGNDVTLGALRGQTVVLYFYPKADTPGCTTQACGIRDHRADYEAAGVTVLGVSPDTVEDVKKFHDKQSLNFRLLADADHSVAEAYGTWGEKTNYGRTYMGVSRSTFIIDGDGVVRHVIPKASPKTHDDVVLKAVGELQAA
jgi:thioredoxin-dependent peroxiredoxin